MSTYYPDVDLHLITEGNNLKVIILSGEMGRSVLEFQTWVNTTRISVFILPPRTAFPTWKEGYPVVDIISCSKEEWKKNKKEIVTKALRDLIIKGSTWSPKTVTWSYNGENYKCLSDPETKNNFVKNARERSGLEQTEVDAENARQDYQFQQYYAGLFY